MIQGQAAAPESDVAAKVGAFCYDDAVQAYAALSAITATLRASGLTVRGLLQRPGETQSNGKPSLWLEDIGSGRVIRLDAPRGPGARACILDTDALAQGSLLLRQAIEAQPDLLIVSRFGSVEAEGGGLRAEIAEAVCSGLAVLIPVRTALLPDLGVFLGCAPTLLPAHPAGVADWTEQMLALA
ncbi:MAG TPA: DUF2478 domain-containing protein [Rhodopila sp.]|nr:DUF2478 domain-containing protein [Rhodopila sp.]